MTVLAPTRRLSREFLDPKDKANLTITILASTVNIDVAFDLRLPADLHDISDSRFLSTDRASLKTTPIAGFAHRCGLTSSRMGIARAMLPRSHEGCPQSIIIRLIVAGSILALAGCANKPPIDLLCPPAGQCPDVQGWHTAGGG